MEKTFFKLTVGYCSAMRLASNTLLERRDYRVERYTRADDAQYSFRGRFQGNRVGINDE